MTEFDDDQGRQSSEDALVRALDQPDPEERRIATAALVALDPKIAVPLVVRALGDVDWRVRKEAVATARALGTDERLVDALLGSLGPPHDVGLRNAAVEVLASLGRIAITALAERVPSLDVDARKLAVLALGRSGDPSAAAALARAAADPDVNVRQAAIEALGSLGPGAARVGEAALVAALDEDHDLLRATALEALAAIGANVPFDRVAPLLGHGVLGGAAALALAASDDPRAAEAVVARLPASRGLELDRALESLARLLRGPARDATSRALAAGGKPLATQLVAVATAAPETSATAALRGRASAPPADAVQRRALALELAAHTGERAAAHACVQALGDVELGQHAYAALLTMGEAALPVVHRALVSALGSAPPPSTAGAVRVHAHAHPHSYSYSVSPLAESAPLSMPPALADAATLVDLLAELLPRAPSRAGDALAAIVEAAARAEPSVAAHALMALAELGGAEHFDAVAALADTESARRAPAAEASLERMGERLPERARAFAAASRAVGGARDFVAAVALAGAGRAEALDPDERAFLVRTASASDPRARAAAVSALAELGGPDVDQALALALADETPRVRAAAARAIGTAAARALGAPAAALAPALAPAERLALVASTGDDDLVASAVRAFGDRLAYRVHGGSHEARASVAPVDLDLPSSLTGAAFAALAPFVASPASAVALAAVEGLARARAPRAELARALGPAVGHADAAVATAALLKLDGDVTAVALGLAHPAVAVRRLAAELALAAALADSSSIAAATLEAGIERALEAASDDPHGDLGATLEAALFAVRAASASRA